MVLKRSLLLLIVSFCTIIGIVSWARAANDTASPWMSSGAPTIQKSVDMTPDVFPATSNFDCVNATVRRMGSSAMYQDCLINTRNGQIGSEGVIFQGATELVPVIPPPPFFNLRGIPGHTAILTYTSAPVLGAYLHFYTSIRDKLPDIPRWKSTGWQLVLNAPPEIHIRDSNGSPLAANLDVMAFSPNGDWMVVDMIGRGLVRINMATFEIQPIAPSLQPANNYSRVTAQIAINNEGTLVVVKPTDYNDFRVYDVAGCAANITLPVASGTMPCPMRDYASEISAQAPALRGIKQVRFVNDTQLAIVATYDYVSSRSFKVATYTMTAPGISPSGIQYLGMGDSFASGEGAFSYLSGTDTNDNTCHQSTKSYAYLISTALFESGHAVSCSGATTDDIEGDQSSYKGQTIAKLLRRERDRVFVEQVKQTYLPGYLVQSEFVDLYKPDALTLSIGGNDIGFSDILTACVGSGTCYPNYEDQLELYENMNGVFDNLVSTYKSLLKPGKRVYVTGYPQVATAGNCANNVHLNASEIEIAIDIIDHLNTVVKQAADKAGVYYVDISDALNGHRMCETDSANVAVNGLTAGKDHGVGRAKVIGRESYHPNALGHQLLSYTIRQKTNDLTAPMPGTNDALQAPEVPVRLDERNLSKSGRTPNTVVFDDNLADGVFVRGGSMTVIQDSVVKSGAVYQITIGGVLIGTATADAQAAISRHVEIPGNVPGGFQILHLTGINQLGQPLDITKTVYIVTDDSDTDGDGIPDETDSCPSLPNANQDIDRDGIDDACDPLIGVAPPPKLSGLKSTVTLTQNTIILIKPH